MNLLVLFLSLLLVSPVIAQNVLFVEVSDSKTQKPLADVNVFFPKLAEGSYTNSEGKATLSYFPNGTHELKITKLGYRAQHLMLKFPRSNRNEVLRIALHPEAIDLENVIVTAVRTNSRIEEIPVRVEVLGLDEIEEKTNMHPASINMMLTETSGIQAQQTSATSGNVQIRLQGLDGKYTQILKDGFPLYGGLANGLSIMQIPPLDLKQVEIVKGSSSALYGGDAIAGVINLVSKAPTKRPEFIGLASLTHKGAKDLNTWYSATYGKIGITNLATINLQSPFDVNKDGFTDLTQYRTITINPKLYFQIDPYTKLTLGVNITNDLRKGGFLKSINENVKVGVEQNQSNRFYTQLKLDYLDEKGGTFTFKNSVNAFHRQITMPQSNFDGKQTATYTEVAYLRKITQHKIVAGITVMTDHFADQLVEDRSYKYATMGGFAQDDWRILKDVTLQAGIRADYVTRRLPTVVRTQGDVFILPRLSATWKPIEPITVRMGGGLGYKSPTIFEVQAEREGFQTIQPFTNSLNVEQSSNINADVQFKQRFFDEWVVSGDVAFFYSRITNPLILKTNPCLIAPCPIYLANANAPIVSRGSEWNVKVNYQDWQFLMAYTYTNARKEYDTQHQNAEFAPRHRFVSTLLYEQLDNFKVGFETAFTGKQYIGNGEQGRSFWTVGLMGEKFFEKFSVIANLENFTDTRQTRFENVLLSQRPDFRPIYAPLDGFVATLGVRVKLD